MELEQYRDVAERRAASHCSAVLQSANSPAVERGPTIIYKPIVRGALPQHLLRSVA